MSIYYTTDNESASIVMELMLECITVVFRSEIVRIMLNLL